MNKLTVEDLDLKGRRVLMRVDFNVPLERGKVANDKRIRAALPTIKYISNAGGKLILMSHLGRPKGKRLPEMSLEPCVTVLNALLGRKVKFIDDCIGETVETVVNNLGGGDILLLENLRYYAQETDNDPDFAAKLAKLGDVYVNDAFGTAHRAHASTEGVTHHISQCAAGFLLMKELDYLGGVMANPDRPFVAILGGAKISGKIDIISNLLPAVDNIIIGGGMTYTFFKAQGKEIGNSLLEEDKIDLAKELLAQGSKKIMKLAQMRFPQMNSVWISDRKRSKNFERLSALQKPLSGTAPWEFLKSKTPQGEPMPSLTPWQKQLQKAPQPLSAVEIPLRRLTRPVWPTKSPTYQPAVARRWNLWRERCCREWRPLLINELKCLK